MRWIGLSHPNIRQGAELEDVRIQLKEIPPKWCKCAILDQFASNYGLLKDVGWQRIFDSFYETVRMMIKCRDASKSQKRDWFALKESCTKLLSLLNNLLVLLDTKWTMGMMEMTKEMMEKIRMSLMMWMT
jgi:hypothetical protein